MFTKIQDSDLEGKGVIGQPAIPGLSVEEMQKSVEQIVREVAIPAVNRLIDELAQTAAAQSVGANYPSDVTGAENTVQAALNSIAQYARTHMDKTDNPHSVTAAQTGAYTKLETDTAIDTKIVEIGAGDMAKSIYDPQSKGKPYIPAEEALTRLEYSGTEYGSVKAAEKLQTARKIGNADFDGTSSVSLSQIGAEPEFEKNSAFNKDFGNSSETVCQGNDARLSDARRASNISMSLSGTTLKVTYS